jgi:hypothetical protein
MLDTCLPQRNSAVFVESSNEDDGDHDGNDTDRPGDAPAAADVGSVTKGTGINDASRCSSRNCLLHSASPLPMTVQAASPTTTTTTDSALPSGDSVFFESGTDELSMVNSYSIQSESFAESADGVTINKSASAVLLGSLSSSLLAISPSSASLSSTPVRPTVSPAAAAANKLSAASVFSSNGLKRCRQRWKSLRKAISVIVDGNRKPDAVEDAPIQQPQQVLQQEQPEEEERCQRFEEQRNGRFATEQSIESLPRLVECCPNVVAFSCFNRCLTCDNITIVTSKLVGHRKLPSSACLFVGGATILFVG